MEAETASPIFTLDRGAIEASGVTTMGQLVQRVPSVSGAATNTAVNNGGGDGASTIELRGLSDERTLVLLNGRRVIGIAGSSGATGGAVDINQFPVNLIERVDVLKEGAGAIYGSDAIGGVVNFITRTEFDGLELSYDYGASSEGDGTRDNFSVAWGMDGDNGSVVISANYNTQDEISANDRDFSRNALYLYGGVVTAGGSSRAPGGAFASAAQLPKALRWPLQYGCGSVTLIDGAPGDSLDDYRCFITSGANADFYNYQPLNLLITPQERSSFFTSANYNLAEDVEVYAEHLHSSTTSGFQIAELPFDSRDDDIVIPANNFYNPFGIAFGGVAAINDDAEWRVVSLGTRHNSVNTDNDHATLGIRGAIMDSGWEWDLSGGYSRVEQRNGTARLSPPVPASGRLRSEFPRSGQRRSGLRHAGQHHLRMHPGQLVRHQQPESDRCTEHDRGVLQPADECEHQVVRARLHRRSFQHAGRPVAVGDRRKLRGI